jgi:hypothetical protein
METTRNTRSTTASGSTTTETKDTTGSHRTGAKKRWAIPTGVVALSAAVLGVLALATPALADDPSDSRVLECRSGIVTQGDVQMSASTATRVPAAQLPDTTPGDCSLR